MSTQRTPEEIAEEKAHFAGESAALPALPDWRPKNPHTAEELADWWSPASIAVRHYERKLWLETPEGQASINGSGRKHEESDWCARCGCTGCGGCGSL